MSATTRSASLPSAVGGGGAEVRAQAGARSSRIPAILKMNFIFNLQRTPRPPLPSNLRRTRPALSFNAKAAEERRERTVGGSANARGRVLSLVLPPPEKFLMNDDGPLQAGVGRH